MVDSGTHEDLALRCETYREFLRTEQRKAELEVKAGERQEPSPVS